jgi:ubiquinone/menaquinone biosynthesis C-methylase UbiE
MIDRPMSKFSFKAMTFILRVRDLFRPPQKVLSKVGMIKPGTHVLDYGCGPGNYSIAAAELVEPSGKVYAVDIHPLAISKVQNKADIKGLRNVQTILTDCNTKLPDSSVDVVLLFYVLHDFKNPDAIIKELNRVLKPMGVLLVIDHKLENEKAVSILCRAAGNLKLRRKGREIEGKKKETTLIFSKE